MYAEKLPPHDIEAEEAVVGSLLLDGDAIARIASSLKPEDFYREKNKWCFEACLAIFARNQAINQISVADELSRHQRLEEVGGQEFLSHVIASVPTPVYVEHYSQLVNRLAIMRRLIQAGGQIANLGYDAEKESEDAIREAEEHIYQLRFRGSSLGLLPIRDALDHYLEESPSSDNDGETNTHPTGFLDLDKLLGGFNPSDLLVLAARPSVGKSSLALNMARAVADSQKTVAVFSLEMSTEQVVERFIAAESGVPTNRIRSNWTDVDERLIMDAIGRLAELQIYIDDSPLLTMTELRSKTRRVQSEHGLDFVIIDYLQLMQGSTREGFGNNRVQEISEITRSMKGLARNLKVPILAASQLSRAVEQRPDRVPQLSDLRESGSIEQDADIVMFIYRADLYFTEEEWERRFRDQNYPKNLAEIIVAKHRHGPVGRVQLVFRDQVSSFADLYRDTTNS
jgi:replicative DNA helicase